MGWGGKQRKQQLLKKEKKTQEKGERWVGAENLAYLVVHRVIFTCMKRGTHHTRWPTLVTGQGFPIIGLTTPADEGNPIQPPRIHTLVALWAER